ncbi:uncharacterized protein LOC141857036 isoform X2 [Brevipalpus obovatus]|uniref:uncharacterized protein LOC141857036 isoform X2 n=1 Tax=Brevipalpus obovatus TaxID=246614 RepID=UPI003D9ECABD
MNKSEASSRRGHSMVNHSNGGSIMERKGFRSLICDEEGVIIGEMVYRCLICSFISESMEKVRNHYQNEHVDIDDSLNGRYLGSNDDYCLSPANSCDQNLCDDSNAPGTVADDPEDEVRGSGINGNSYGTKSRSGYIVCKVCCSKRFYSYVQRRYGQYSCSACYRHFRDFLLKPKIFSCPTLGSCSLEAKNKCRACWLLTCINVFNENIDEDKRKIMYNYQPVKDEGDADEPDPGDPEDLVDYDQDKDDSGSELTSIKPHDSLLDDQEERGTISGDEQTETNTQLPVKRNLKGHKILKKVSSSKRKRNWSCMKCSNCLKQECGKCVYCLDRPKYGGQFRLRQRCADRRCLLKAKDNIS